MSANRWVQVAAVVAAVLAGIPIGRASSSAAQPAAHPTASAPQPVQTARGAAIAAIEFLEALRWDVVIDDQRRRRVIADRATEDAAAALDRELAGPSGALSEAVATPPVVARTAVLGYRTRRAGARDASVRVWGVALFGTGSYRPTTQWSTSDIELEWTGDRWLVSGVESRGGPAPNSGTKQLARSTGGLKEVRHVP